MKTKQNKIKVVFRKFKDGEIIALFPSEDWSHGMITSYQHIGQYGGADPLIVYDTKPATPEEYAPLLVELVAIGYDNLRVCKKCVS